MPTQFDQVMNILENILHRLTAVEEQIRAWIQSEADDLFGDDPLDERLEAAEEYLAEMKNQTGEDYSPGLTYIPSETRTHVEVRNLDGGVEMVSWDEIDQRIIDAINVHKELTRRNPDILLGPWQLYRDPQGMIRISVDQAVLTELHKKETYQQPVPQTMEIPKDMDIDEVAKER